MDYHALKTLLLTNPEHGTASSSTLATWCNYEAVSEDLDSLGADVVYQAIDSEEFIGLTEARQTEVIDILKIHSYSGVPTAQGKRARSRIIGIFGAQSTTIETLAALISVPVSRAHAAGIMQVVTPGDVEHALSL